jgi:hypothetical protein
MPFSKSFAYNPILCQSILSLGLYLRQNVGFTNPSLGKAVHRDPEFVSTSAYDAG